jgi:hypothetical protein
VPDLADDAELDWADPPVTSTPDPFESVDDEGGTELHDAPRPEPATRTIVDDDGDEFDAPLPPGELDDRVRLPWKTTVVVVVRGKTLPAVLDATADTSTWVGGPADANGKEQVLWLDTLTLRVTLAVEPGDEELVRLGRDALGGRVLIEA